MKRQSIVFILLLLQVLFICMGCGSSEKSTGSVQMAAMEETAIATDDIAEAEAAAAPLMEDVPTADMSVMAEEGIAPVEDAVGVFEGLEDNHTAIFSFDGAETAFYFEDPEVQNVLFEAVIGSTYTLSYDYIDTFGCRIYKITEY